MDWLRSKSHWRKAKSRGTAAKTSATRKLAGKLKKRCTTTGGDKESCKSRWKQSRSQHWKPKLSFPTFSKRLTRFRDASRSSIRLPNGLLRNLAKSGELTGKTLEMTLIHAPAGLKAARFLLVGAGKREQFDSATLRKIAGAALRYLKSRSVKQFAFCVRENNATEEFSASHR